MPESVDSRTPVAVATSGLSGDIRRILERLGTAGVQAVQLSTGQRGTSPRDLDRSGRQDLGVVIRRRELRLAGIDHAVDPDQLLAPDGVDVAATVLLEAIQLAGDLGPVPISVRFPPQGGDEVIQAAVATASRLGVDLVDFGVPPRGRSVREREVARGGGLVVPGQTDESPVTHDARGSTVEGVGIGIDPPSWLSAGLDFEVAAGEGVSGVRLAGLTVDGFRVPAGVAGSRVDPAVLLAVARSSGFEGDPVIDPRGWSDPWRGIEHTRAAMSSVE